MIGMASHLSAVRANAWTWDAVGHCSSCHLAYNAIRDTNALIAAGAIRAVSIYTVCGHVLIYRR